ncbi:MAG: NifB/NifX family molybdenum-iron cluster-binding protein [Methanoregula sp.]
MKICITAQGPAPDSPVEERFGRAPYYIMADTETGAIEAVKNPFADGAGGVGPKAAGLVAEHKAGALVSGPVGGNAKEALSAAGIAQYSSQGCATVRDALDAFKKNSLEKTGD